MPLDESGWPAPFSRWDVAVQTHPSSISQAACYNAAMVYVPVAMLPGGGGGRRFHVCRTIPPRRVVVFGLAQGARVSRLPFVQMDGDAMFEA